MINVTTYYDEQKRRHTHFISEYPDNKYVEKTVAFLSDDHYSIPGRIQVFMRNGESYSFDAWVTLYSGYFGINVSDDGRFVYVISKIKGLRCYTYKGEIVWKTRYTAPGYVIPHPDNSLTTELSKKIAVLDHNGKIITSRRLWDYSVTDWLSNELISAQIGADRLTLLNCRTLDIVREFSLKKLGFVRYSYSRLSGSTFSVTGESATLGWPTTIHIDLDSTT